MAVTTHPIHLGGRRMSLEDLDTHLRAQGFANYHGLSTYLDGSVSVVVSNDHTDTEYARLRSTVKTRVDEWDEIYERDGRLRRV